MDQHAQNETNRSGGPSTLEAKSRSSQNALTHGCRSTIVILPGESQKDFDDLYDRWMAFYEPVNEAEAELPGS